MLFWSAVIAVSAVFRLWALDLLEGRLPDGDTPNYLAIAHNILSGRGIVLDDPNNLPNMRATYPPFYPIVVAGVGLFLPLTFAVITALNTAIDLACAWLMTRLGAALGQARAGTLAAALYIVWPTNMGMAPLARKEGLIALLVLALLVSLVRVAQRGEWRFGALYGFLAGLLTLTQPGLLFLPILLALVARTHFTDRSRWFGLMAVAAACATLTILPWWIRNWILFSRFVPLTAAGGYSLWIGSTPLGDGTWIQPPERFRLGDEFRMSAAMGDEARRIIAADPVRYVIHCITKFFRAMLGEHRGVTQIYWAEPRDHQLIARIWIAAATIAHVIALQVALIAAVFRRGQLLSRFLLAAIAQILLFGIWFEFDQRHRYFITPLLLLVAASWVLERRTRRSRKKTSAL